jgi:hypothetical protein
MNVVAFKAPAGIWTAAELHILARDIGRHGIVWETGTTERGDPQVYLLGPRPDRLCLLCISRLGRSYILEDETGQVISEHDDLARIARRAQALVAGQAGSRLWAGYVRIGLLWCAIRQAIYEKLEPVLVEGEDLLVLVVPQFAAFA